MSTVLRLPDPGPRRPRGPSRGVRPSRETLVVGGVAVLAALARAPFVGRPLSPDEGGLLLVASQWAPGRSLYGNYWVDRPPLLVDFFALAAHLGGAVPLRVLGIVLVMASVALSGGIGILVVGSARGRRTATGAGFLTSSTAAVFLCSPLFGASEVNGELVAVPLVLAGVLLILVAARADTEQVRSTALAAAGAAGAAAALVKQNEVDVFVVLAVSVVTLLRRRRTGTAWRDVGAAVGGGVALTVVVLARAATRGTDPAGLWHALVTFRLEATAVIHSSASAATGTRLTHLALALVVSGAPLLVALYVGRLRTPPTSPSLDLRRPGLALLTWETVSVLGGGSYWLHYLVCLVPGLVLVVAVLSADPRRGTRRAPAATGAVLGYAAIVAACSIGVAATHLDRPTAQAPLEDWLAAHAGRHDTVVIAYGNVNVLQATGLASPYRELWSLPVRVDDPHLDELAGVLAGKDRPDWVVTGSRGLRSWGIDATAGEAQLAAHYREVAEVGRHDIYLERSRTTP